jgi:hypothetical protein
MERERYGRGSGGGINRYPDVSGRTASNAPTRDDRGSSRNTRQDPPRQPRDPNEPWSDVPPELEAILRAQVAQKPAPSRESTRPLTGPDEQPGQSDEAIEAAPKSRATRKPAAAKTPSAKAPAKPRAPRKAAAPASSGGDPVTAEPTTAAKPAAKAAPKPRAPRKPKVAAEASGDAVIGAVDTAGVPAVAKPKRSSTRKTAPAETA